MAWAWRRQTSNVSAPCHVAKKITDMFTGETMKWSVVKGHLQRGILLHLMCYLVVSKVTEGLNGNGCFTLGVQAILISGKYPHSVSELLQAVLSKEQQCCDRNHLSTHTQKFSSGMNVL
jgi:hypothetical protein